MIAQQLASMEEAGIDTIIVSWHGWGDTNFDEKVDDREKEAMQRALIEPNGLHFDRQTRRSPQV